MSLISYLLSAVGLKKRPLLICVKVSIISQADYRSIPNHDYFLTLTVIRDKVRPFSAQYGTDAFVSKYGTILFFKGRLATLVPAELLCSSVTKTHCLFNLDIHQNVMGE